MSMDIVEQLRAFAENVGDASGRLSAGRLRYAADVIERLRAEVAEWVEEAFLETAIEMNAERDGDDLVGWMMTNATSTSVEAGERLVSLGIYERHPSRGGGRVQWYRRKEETQAATGPSCEASST